MEEEEEVRRKVGEVKRRFERVRTNVYNQSCPESSIEEVPSGQQINIVASIEGYKMP